ncbi:hypothetical protein PILCRDRAFT_813821 [Piloderma croceum F 1598]|uniref:tRNA (guanine(37)-N1)-methyltransferase n=1 Tax=Piloderma croceum (strain F 1598) TaxID=765440 RepID=A0A0C3CGF9_PILCF|nr:hypothetical protein PILCRDRAFT_813821 [Piloderma croceum F 1598]
MLRVSNEAELTPEAREYLKSESVELMTYTLELHYDYWLADDILKAIFPEELCKDSPTGFAVTGHIAHLNLTEAYLPYKYIIGQVILDKNKTIKTVVNKLNTINTEFRFFKMELIAGEQDYVVEHHESDCRFIFDFSQVYWNSRLQAEHKRVVQLFEPGDVVADVFAGVGPFAIPAARNGCAVFANDLNPIGTKYLRLNVEKNRVKDLVKVTCQDGRNFIREVTARSLKELFPLRATRLSLRQQRLERKDLKIAMQILALKNTNPTVLPRPRIDHFVMNLPDSAINFLDAFRGIMSPASLGRDVSAIYNVMPMVHCYCFTRELEYDKAEVDIRKRVEEQLGYPLVDEVDIHMVRSVAPFKDMYCISFRLPRIVAFEK